MKKTIYTALLLLLVNSVFSQGFKFGGGFALGPEMGIDEDFSNKMGVGLHLKGGYLINEKFSAMGNFTYFFPSAPEGVNLKAFQLAADAHYIFFNNEDLNFYSLAGLNYSYIKADATNSPYTGSADNSSIGLDVGIGMNHKILFGEIKYDTGFDQFQITVGVEF